MTAGLKTLELISEPGFHDRIAAQTERLTNGMEEKARAAGIGLSTNRAGAMFGLFFTSDGPVTNYAKATACNQDQFRQFFHSMLDQGIYLAPSAFEAGFVSGAHGDAEIEETLDAASKAFAILAG
jgi:glutamate-1-semialdehyde 2,1-aminomutase